MRGRRTLRQNVVRYCRCKIGDLSAYFAMVRVAAFRKNFDRAYTLLERAENLGTMRDWGRLCAAMTLERVWLHLKEGISEAIVAHEHLGRLAEKYQPLVDFAWSDIHRYSALARAYLASEQQTMQSQY
jgi:LuxR family transcriptional regulator, maltose regulon positive regulatory protein